MPRVSIALMKQIPSLLMTRHLLNLLNFFASSPDEKSIKGHPLSIKDCGELVSIRSCLIKSLEFEL